MRFNQAIRDAIEVTGDLGFIEHMMTEEQGRNSLRPRNSFYMQDFIMLDLSGLIMCHFVTIIVYTMHGAR